MIGLVATFVVLSLVLATWAALWRFTMSMLNAAAPRDHAGEVQPGTEDPGKLREERESYA